MIFVIMSGIFLVKAILVFEDTEIFYPNLILSSMWFIGFIFIRKISDICEYLEIISDNKNKSAITRNITEGEK